MSGDLPLEEGARPQEGDFPGGLVAKMLASNVGRPEFNPCSWD